MGWADNWPLMIRLNNQLQEALGAEGYQTAWERGARIDMSEILEELHDLLEP